MIHSIPGSRGKQVVTYPATIKQLKVPQKGLGICIWINKSHILSWICSSPLSGTKTAKAEGLWLINRPKCFVLEYPDHSPKVWWSSPFIVPSLYSMRDPCDVMKWCHDHLLWSSSGKTTVHAHQNCQHSSAHLLVSSPEPPTTMNASKPLHLFLNPIFTPVTLSPQVFQCALLPESYFIFIFLTKHRQAL